MSRISFSSAEDFRRWDWGWPSADQSIDAAQMVMHEIENDTFAYVAWKDANVIVSFGLFEDETTLSVSLETLIDEWIESRLHKDGKVDEKDEALGMADRFAAMATKLRAVS